MIIAVIGAGISGLVAGSRLAQAGHQVTIFEKSRGFGGRLATRYAGENLLQHLDHGSSFLDSGSGAYQEWLDGLSAAGAIRPWTDRFSLHDGTQFYREHGTQERRTRFVAVEGMNSLGKALSRWVDVRMNERVAGITLVAPKSTRKRPWVVNLVSGSVFEADAVVVAAPAPQAQGVIGTALDEVGVRSLIAQLKKVTYAPAFALMAGYGGRQKPEWQGIHCQNQILEWICNESDKRDSLTETCLVVHASTEFTRANLDADREEVRLRMLEALPAVVGPWASLPEWTELHLWRYRTPETPLQGVDYLEFDNPNAPLALVGDYFGEGTLESAYRSGWELATAWLARFTK